MLEQSNLPLSLLQCLSFKKKSWVWKFSHLPEELTTSSIQFNSFQIPMKLTGQREFKNFFSCLLFSSFFHVCTRVCVGNYKRNWNVKNSKKLLESPSPILFPLIIRDVSFQTFLYTYIIFKKWGGKLFCSYSEACFLFFGQQYMAIYPCVNIQTQGILFHCSAIFHDMNVPWLISLLPLQYF